MDRVNRSHIYRSGQQLIKKQNIWKAKKPRRLETNNVFSNEDVGLTRPISHNVYAKAIVA